TVLATSSDGSTNSADFTVAVTNLNDNPVVGPSDTDAGDNKVAENAATGTVVGITALATDADVGATISYSLSDNAGGRFSIDSATGVVKVADGTLLDSLPDALPIFTVLATSSDGSTNSADFTVAVTAMTDTTPPTVTAVTDNIAASVTNGPISFS